MRLLKYVILSLIFLNIPSVMLVSTSPIIGGLLSYLTYGLLLLYFILNKGGKPYLPVLLLGVSYFVIAGFNFYNGEVSEYFISFAKFLIVIFGGSVLVKDISPKELFVFLLIASISILFEALFLPSLYGRYGGLYINANLGGFAAIMAYTLTFKIKNRNLGLLFQIIITLCGLATFSRTFVVLWVLVNLISIGINIKNIRILGVGFGMLLLIIIFGNLFKLNTQRIERFSAIIHKEDDAIKNVNEGSRTETWAPYFKHIYEKPIFGNGYNSFRSIGLIPGRGVHNSFLLIIGEAGIFPFLLCVGLILSLIAKGVKYFKIVPYLLMQSLTLAMFMLVFHNFFVLDYVLIILLWIPFQYKIASNQLLETNPDLKFENSINTILIS